MPTFASDYAQQDATYLAQLRSAEVKANLESSLAPIAKREAIFQEQVNKEQWNLYKKQADTSGKLASQFLSSWGGTMAQVQSMFGDASTAMKSVMSGLSGGASGGLGDLTNLMKQSYQEYKTEYGPMAKEFLSGARETQRQKSAIAKELMTGTKTAKQAEGAAGRAYADTMVQAETQNAAAARRMMSMGLDPSGGAFGTLTRRGAVDTAGAAVGAMNTARLAEKNRLTALNLNLMNALNPSEAANIGLGINQQGTQLLTNAANMETSRLSALGNVASSFGNMASGYANAVANPYAELSGYYLGKSGGAINPSAFTLQGTGALNSLTALQRPLQSGQNYLGRVESATGATRAALESGAFSNYPRGAITKPNTSYSYEGGM